MNLEIAKTKREVILEAKIRLLEKKNKELFDLAIGLQAKLNAVK